MAIGKRIKHIRKLRGLTQKELGSAIGFGDRTSDVRIAQYESESRVPKDKILADIAQVLQVSPQSLDVPDIDTYIGLMHTLFALEDMYGLKIDNIDGELCLTLKKHDNPSYPNLSDRFQSWHEEYQKLAKDEIIQEEYNHWRYTYPQVSARRTTNAITDAMKADKGKRTFK